MTNVTTMSLHAIALVFDQRKNYILLIASEMDQLQNIFVKLLYVLVKIIIFICQINISRFLKKKNGDDDDDKCGEVILRGKSANKGLCASAIPYLHHSNVCTIFVHLCSCISVYICVFFCIFASAIPYLHHSNMCIICVLLCLFVYL